MLLYEAIDYSKVSNLGNKRLCLRIYILGYNR